jgi:phosphinothricin tripeptide acetyl hydrolase
MLAHGIGAIRKHLAELPTMDDLGIPALRKIYDSAERAFDLPLEISVSMVECGGRPGELLEPPGGGRRAMVYLHGGGYVLGSPQSHRHMIATLALAADAAVLVPDYRLAPEAIFPAALDDAVGAYDWLRGRGWRANQITMAGDSAGGGLCVATLLYLKDRNVALPGAAICISPWTDMTASGASYQTRADVEPLVKAASLRHYADLYRGDRALDDPLLSPLFGDLSGLPPLLIQVGSDEILLDDARELYARAKAAGTDATLEVWQGMFHVWHWFGEYLDEAAAASRNVADFMRRHCPA